jgi:mRNA interferase YafQ
MITVSFAPSFLRQLKALPDELQEEAIEKIEFFANIKNHKMLKVHKLKGRLSDRHSFSVNYNYRIVFQYATSKEVVLLAIGDHDIYKK